MTLERADEIRVAWGKFLEVANPGLLKTFRGHIPQSILPYDKEAIKESIDICADYFMSKGDRVVAEILKTSKQVLERLFQLPTKGLNKS